MQKLKFGTLAGALYIATFIVSLLSSQVALAWGDLGHETTAQIAELILKSEPKTLKQIQNIIGVEPLAIAATWPDHIRSDSRFASFSGYHFVDFFEDTSKHKDKDALVVLKKFTALLKDASVPREIKMIALRYVIHVAGDVHQPLHAGNEFDYGGNACKVDWNPTALTDAKSNVGDVCKAKNLHSVWDTSIVEFLSNRVLSSMPNPPKYFGYTELAPALMAKHKDIVNSKESTDVDEWVKQSLDLTKTGGVYPDNLPANNRPYCNLDCTKIRRTDVPVLGKEFATRNADLAEKQLVLGGLRLAKLLKLILADQDASGPSEADIFKALDIKN